MNCWVETLCTVEARVLGWLYKEFYGRPFDESTLFRVAHAYESTTDWHKRRPPLDAGKRKVTAP